MARFLRISALVVLAVVGDGCGLNDLGVDPDGSGGSASMKGKHVYSLRTTGLYVYACAGADGLFRRPKPGPTQEWQDISNGWQLMSGDISHTTAQVRDVWVQDGREDLMLVSIANSEVNRTGIFKSTDGGLDWFGSDNGLTIEQPRGSSRYYRDATVLFSPTQPSAAVYTTTRRGFAIFRSMDHADSWNAVVKVEDPDFNASSISRIVAFASHPVRAHEIWAGGQESGFSGSWGILMKSQDGGATWQSAQFPRVSNSSVESVAISQSSGQMYVGLAGFVLLSNDGGGTWMNVLDANRGDDRLQVVCTDSQVIAAGGSSLFESLDDGTTWQRRPSPVEGITAFHLDLGLNLVYLGSDSSGVYARNL